MIIHFSDKADLMSKYTCIIRVGVNIRCFIHVFQDYNFQEIDIKYGILQVNDISINCLF